MFEQDYIMRVIKEMIRVLLKLLFQIDTASPSADLLEESQQEQLNGLLHLIDDGQINKAENLVFEMTSDQNMANLETALLFYSYLNDKEDAFLQEHNYSREEIQSGVKDLASRYGLAGITEAFLS